MLGDIDLNKKFKEPVLHVAKLDGVPIGKVKHYYNLSFKPKLGTLSELSFDVPYDVERNNELIRNPIIDKLKEDYRLKFNLGEDTEYFIIKSISDSMDDTTDTRTIEAVHLGYECTNKLIRDYEVVSKNATAVLNDALLSTLWSVGYVDSSFDIKYRSFEVNEKSVLDFVYEVAETFGGVLKFHSSNRTIDLVKEESVGSYKGFQLSYGKYMRTLDKDSTTDEQVTRLKVYGNEGLSIQSVNPTGSSYIEDFSYYMYPYQEDENGNVIQSSDYISDGLVKAILNYNELLETKSSLFSSYLDELELLNSEYSTLEDEMFSLEMDLIIIEDSLDVAKANDEDTTDLESQKAAKQTEISNKQDELDSKDAEISGVEAEISILRDEISVENNFTPEQIQERNKIIKEKTWEDSNYTDPQDLYDEAVLRMKEMKKPKTVFKIDIISFFHLIEEQRNWDKVNLGDTIRIYYEKFDVNIMAKIIEIDYDFENQEINLTIANTKDIESEEDKLVKMLYQSHSTSTKVDMTNYKIAQTERELGEVNEVINNTWDAAKRRISAGVNNSIDISGRGIIVSDPDYPEQQVIIQSGVIALTQDDGNTWKTAITPTHVVAERLAGKIIAGVNLTVENDSGKYTMDSNGFTIDGGSLFITGGLPKDQLDPEFADGLFEIDKDYSNGVRMDSTNGIVVTRSDGKVRTAMNATGGIKIQKDNLGTWEDKFYADTDGNLIAEELITRKISIRDSNDNTIIDADTGTIDFSKFPNKIGVIDGENLELKGLTINNGLEDTLVIDDSGNISMSGNINMTGGSISWSGVNAPTASQVGARDDSWVPYYSQITGTKPPTNANNTEYELRYNNDIRGFYYNSSTGNLELSADYISAGTIDAGDINVINLNASNITAGTISGDRIDGGIINGATLKVSDGALITDVGIAGMRVSGDTIYIQDGDIYIGDNDGSYNLGNETYMYNKTNFYDVIRILGDGVSNYSSNYGGFYMVDSSWVRIWNNKGLYTTGVIKGQIEDTSDRTVKKNLLTLEDKGISALPFIKDTPVYEYHMTHEEDNDRKHVGIMSDEAPDEIVSYHEDSPDGIKVYEMCAYLWKAVQELSQEVDYLKSTR